MKAKDVTSPQNLCADSTSIMARHVTSLFCLVDPFWRVKTLSNPITRPSNSVRDKKSSVYSLPIHHLSVNPGTLLATFCDRKINCRVLSFHLYHTCIILKLISIICRRPSFGNRKKKGFHAIPKGEVNSNERCICGIGSPT